MDVQDLKIAVSPVDFPTSLSGNEPEKSPGLQSFLELLENGDGSEVEERAKPEPEWDEKSERDAPMKKKRKVKEATMIAAAFRDMLTSICNMQKQRILSSKERGYNSDDSLEETCVLEKEARDLELQRMQYEREDRKELVGVLRQIAKTFDRIADKL